MVFNFCITDLVLLKHSFKTLHGITSWGELKPARLTFPAVQCVQGRLAAFLFAYVRQQFVKGCDECLVNVGSSDVFVTLLSESIKGECTRDLQDQTPTQPPFLFLAKS